MPAIIEKMLETWTNGGWVMLAMGLLAVVLYTTAWHVLFQLRVRGIVRASDDTVRSWVRDPETAPGSVRELIRYSQDEAHSLQDIEGRFREVEASRVLDVDRRLAFMNVLVVAAPLFGLLGTVLGMLLTFKAIGVGGGSSTSEIIAKGISEALVATQTGMMVAIPGLLMAYVAKSRRDEFVAFLVRLEAITLRHFGRPADGVTKALPRRAAQPRPQPAVALGSMPALQT